MTVPVDEQALAQLLDDVAAALYDERSRLVTVKHADRPRGGSVAVMAAGTSDQPVAEEAALTLEASGTAAQRITDVGVAGLHRVLEHRGALEAADCAIVV